VFPLKKGNNFLLGGSLLLESSIESFFGGVNRKTASFDEFLCVLLEMQLEVTQTKAYLAP
jgi:hypothetical protein